MSIELPYPGPNHIWSIGKQRRRIKEGEPGYPEDWNENRHGFYYVLEPSVILHRYYIHSQNTGSIESQNGHGERLISLTNAENAQEWADYMSNRNHRLDSGPAEPVGPWYSEYEEGVVSYEGGFLGLGRKKVVTYEKKLLGWKFKMTTPEVWKFIPEGFTQKDVLEAAQNTLAEKRNKDHEKALLDESERHFGFYPPKKLSEQFPDKA